MPSPPITGTLYVVATPIGNLGDISRRAETVLKQAALIACEDTRHTRKLLSHLGLSTPTTSYYREKEREKTAKLIRMLLAGSDIALVSDAGTPGISDPGAVLVAAAHAHGIKVASIAGPCALTAALSLAGLQDSAFYFAGFPPAKSAQRLQLFKNLASLPCPLIFYEAPHRILATLEDLRAALGNRQAQLFRELTKQYEERRAGTLSALAAGVAHGIKGELVLIVAGAPEPEPTRPQELDELLRWYRDIRGSSLKEAVQAIAVDLQLNRSAVYQRALELWRESD